MCSSHLNPSGHSDLWNWLSLSLNPTAPLSKHSTNLSRASPSWLTGVPKRVPAVLLCRVGRNIRTRSNGNRSALAIVEYQNTHRNIKKEGMTMTLNCEHQKSLHLPVTATCYFGPFHRRGLSVAHYEVHTDMPLALRSAIPWMGGWAYHHHIGEPHSCVDKNHQNCAVVLLDIFLFLFARSPVMLRWCITVLYM